MSLVWFEGAAGTGKTSRLFDSARQHLLAHPLSEGQRVLALTKFHGSRKRLDAKLNRRDGLGVPVTCSTIDSFALRIVQRWRGLARQLGLTPTMGDFQGITSAAGQLLQNGVGAWVGRSFPLVIIDEMQDCQGGEVELLAGLEAYVHCIAAADAFQDLSGNLENEAVAWASQVSSSIPLTTVHRTQQNGLLEVAYALRSGAAVTLVRKAGFEILASPAAAMAAAVTSWRIKSWSGKGEIAIISPNTRARSRFVDQLTKWVEKNAAKSKTGAVAGPYHLFWEDTDKEVCERLQAAIGVQGDANVLVACSQMKVVARTAGIRELEEWVRRQQFIRGRETVTSDEICAELLQIVSRRRAFATTGQRGRLALTVHQAKNREFDFVVVLWPLTVRADIEQQRRQLYNAITRAKVGAVVIVEDPRKNRLKGPLFAGTS